VKQNEIRKWNLFIDLDNPRDLIFKIDEKTKFLVKRYVSEKDGTKKPKIDIYRNYNFLRNGKQIKLGFRGLFLEKTEKHKGNIYIYLDYILGF
jgi:hypothetical protein